MTFCDPAGVDDWLICPGKLTLEESEDPVVPAAYATDTAFREYVEGKAGALQAEGFTVRVVMPATVSIEIITGESGAHDLVDALLIDEKEGKTRLSVYGIQHRREKLKLDALAAYLQYSLLYDITAVVVDGMEAVTLDELYVFGARVTEAASVALSVRGEASVTNHLNPGRQCLRCRSAYRCPVYQALV